MTTGPSIYTASKPRHAAMWRDLRDQQGYNVIATWIDYENDEAVQDWEKLWVDCFNEARAAAVTLVYLEAGDQLRGAYVEMGVAMASGALVFIANPHKERITDAIHHPQVTEFDSLAAALDAIDRLTPLRMAA
jgi:hypothetical protein